jgi:hypothetical protein
MYFGLHYFFKKTQYAHPYEFTFAYLASPRNRACEGNSCIFVASEVEKYYSL